MAARRQAVRVQQAVQAARRRLRLEPVQQARVAQAVQAALAEPSR
jgi:hypothetical protein